MIKKFRQYMEDATCDASNTSGMGSITSAQPGSLPGTTGTEGSGDVSFGLKTNRKRKKGSPREVSDLRDLKDVKTNKVNESISLDKEYFDTVFAEFIDDHETDACLTRVNHNHNEGEEYEIFINEPKISGSDLKTYHDNIKVLDKFYDDITSSINRIISEYPTIKYYFNVEERGENNSWVNTIKRRTNLIFYFDKLRIS